MKSRIRKIKLNDEKFYFFQTPFKMAKMCKGMISIGTLSRDLGGFAFGHDGLLELHAELLREFVDAIVAINFNGLLGGVQDHVAVVAPMKVFI